MTELIALMLRSCGFDVVVASDGDAALAAILFDGTDGPVSETGFGLGLHDHSALRSASDAEGVAGSRVHRNSFGRWH